jgi:hypothetical protein
MSATGPDVFDKTIQTTNVWLSEIMQEIGPIGGARCTPCAPCFMRCAIG